MGVVAPNVMEGPAFLFVCVAIRRALGQLHVARWHSQDLVEGGGAVPICSSPLVPRQLLGDAPGSKAGTGTHPCPGLSPPGWRRARGAGPLQAQGAPGSFWRVTRVTREGHCVPCCPPTGPPREPINTGWSGGQQQLRLRLCHLAAVASSASASAPRPHWWEGSVTALNPSWVATQTLVGWVVPARLPRNPLQDLALETTSLCSPLSLVPAVVTFLVLRWLPLFPCVVS